ncbi:MEIKN protein, partial [Thinocorus orbignyianus]|nr:MEIKN protein [Thinocorus orbignyianus]
MTLPTGVSTYLLECLDVDSTADYNTGGSDSLNSCSSPETFRDDHSGRSNFYSGKKNSTLLDSSKAVAIDKIPQISNLSAILEPVADAFQDQNIKRKRPSDCSSSALSASTAVAGKTICKITAATERTPDLKAGMRCSSPLGPERKPDSQTAEPKKLKSKKKGKKSNILGESSSSFRQLDSSGNASTKSDVLPPQRTAAVVALCGRPKICSIIRTSPCRRPPRLRPIPVNAQPFRLPEGVPEDIITNTKIWTCCKQK